MNESVYNEECAFFVNRKGTYLCKALKEWYNSETHDRCKDCPFFKTPEQLLVDSVKNLLE